MTLKWGCFILFHVLSLSSPQGRSVTLHHSNVLLSSPPPFFFFSSIFPAFPLHSTFPPSVSTSFSRFLPYSFSLYSVSPCLSSPFSLTFRLFLLLFPYCATLFSYSLLTFLPFPFFSDFSPVSHNPFHSPSPSSSSSLYPFPSPIHPYLSLHFLISSFSSSLSYFSPPLFIFFISYCLLFPLSLFSVLPLPSSPCPFSSHLPHSLLFRVT